MTAPFDRKSTGIYLIALPLVPIIVHIFMSETSTLALVGNWLFSGIIAWVISDLIDRHHLGTYNNNHALPISWSIISSVLTFALINFNEAGSSSIDLIQMTGFASILYFVTLTWQQRVSPILYMISGGIIGIVSVFFHFALLWIFLFPVIFYHMRTTSRENYGSLFTGLLLTIWIVYCLHLLVFGEASADAYILSYKDIIEEFRPDVLDYTPLEWVMLAFTLLLLIIYSISGYTLNVTKSVMSEGCVTMFSTLSLILAVISIFDITHLPNYLGLLSILLCLQISIHQSCILKARNDWWIISAVIILTIMNVFSIIYDKFADILQAVSSIFHIYS